MSRDSPFSWAVAGLRRYSTVYTYTGVGHRAAKAADGVTTTTVVAMLGLTQVLVEATGRKSILYSHGCDLLVEAGDSGWAWHLGEGLGAAAVGGR